MMVHKSPLVIFMQIATGRHRPKENVTLILAHPKAVSMSPRGILKIIWGFPPRHSFSLWNRRRILEGTSSELANDITWQLFPAIE